MGDSPTLCFSMEQLFKGVGREIPPQQGAVGYNSLLMVDKGYTIDSSRSIEAEYRIYEERGKKDLF